MKRTSVFRSYCSDRPFAWLNRHSFPTSKIPSVRVARQYFTGQRAPQNASSVVGLSGYLCLSAVYIAAFSPILLLGLLDFWAHQPTHGLIPKSSTLQQLSRIADPDQVAPPDEDSELTPIEGRLPKRSPTQFIIGAGERLTRPDAIRLLTIYPETNVEAPVKCSLQQTLHSGAPEYEALSYCRTTVSGTDVLFCNGETLAVPQSLSDALKAIRLTGQKRTIWVDAVCIDQDDVEDRSLQVRNIGKIFSQASLVWVYLGKDDSAAGALDAVESVSKGDTIRNLSQIRTILNLFELPWFERLWVVQELCQADRVVAVHGDHWVPWTDVEKVACFLHAQLVRSGIGRHIHSQNINRVQTLIKLRQKTKDPQARHSLLDLVFATQEFKVSDPRDRIFALVGLADDVSEADWELSPDYTSDTKDVYQRLALWSLAKRGDLRILSWPYILRRESNLNLPSWVPDLSCPLSFPAPEILAVKDDIADKHEAMSFAGYGPQPRLPRRIEDLIRPRRHRYADGIERPFLHTESTQNTQTQQTFANLSRVSFSSDNKVLHLVGWQVSSVLTVGDIAFTNSPRADMNVLFLLGVPCKRWSPEDKAELIRFVSWTATECRTWLSGCVKLAKIAGLNPESLSPQREAAFDPLWRTLCCDRLMSGRRLDEINEDLYYNLSNLLPRSDLNTQISRALDISERDLAKLAEFCVTHAPAQTLDNDDVEQFSPMHSDGRTDDTFSMDGTPIHSPILPSQQDDTPYLPSCFNPYRASNPVQGQQLFLRRYLPSTNNLEITDVLQRNHHVMRYLYPSIVKWSRSRRIALTTDHQLANVPPSAREGDMVCIFFGASVPYILRPREDGYFELVGECYVDGIMRGGAVYDAENMSYTRPLQAVFAIK